MKKEMNEHPKKIKSNTGGILLAAINAKYIHSNLAVYSLRAYAGKQGIETELAEYTINQPLEAVLSDVYEKNPSVLCLSCYIWNIEYVKELVTEFHKLRPEAPIWLGGPEVSFRTEEFLQENPAVTGIMMGEGERTFTQLCRYYRGGTGAPELQDIPGITWRDKRKIPEITCGDEKKKEFHVNPAAEPIAMDELPFCYGNLTDFENRIIYYESSRGCPFSCSYCLSSVDKHLRMRSLTLVYEELQFFLDHKVPQVKFVDRTFNCSHQHALGIWNYIREHDNGVTNFHFEVSADLLNEEELCLLESLRPGLVQLEIGVQSTNDDTIHEIHRTMNLNRLKAVVQRVKSAGNIHQHLDLIAGLPLEDYESFRRSFDDIYRLKIQQLQLGFLKVLKGSYMYEMAGHYQLLYRDKPPYEVLQSRWLSYGEIQKIKMVEEMLEIHYNSGQFLRTLAVLELKFDSPFAMYLQLADFYREQGLDKMSHTRLARAEILYNFAVKVDSDHETLYGETLLFDLYIRENIKARPRWAPDLSGLHKQTSRMLRDMGYEKKYCHVEPFHYSVFRSNPWEIHTGYDEISYMEEPYLLLFDYEKRSPFSREAECSILATVHG
ncbi:MAG: B12-binding domain-containing radical SAM protein [Lachnospiraceae bacterium]|nr:B12-binding domain-containing radical SAM protein [Lachnospiraceae bacterium]